MIKEPTTNTFATSDANDTEFYRIVISYVDELPAYVREGVANFIQNHASFAIARELGYNITLHKLPHKTSKFDAKYIKEHLADFDVYLTFYDSQFSVLSHLYNFVVNDPVGDLVDAEAVEMWLANFTSYTLPPAAFIVEEGDDVKIQLRLPNSFEIFAPIMPDIIKTSETVSLVVENVTVKPISIHAVQLRTIKIGVVENYGRWYTLDFIRLYDACCHEAIVKSAMESARKLIDKTKLEADIAALFLYSTYDIEMYS